MKISMVYKNILFAIFTLLITGFLSSPVVAADNQNSIKIQLKWYHKFQFAGYYAAQKEGYFDEYGLNVELIEGSPTQTPARALEEGTARYAVMGSELILSYAKGLQLSVLAPIFQQSPDRIFIRGESQIFDVKDLTSYPVIIPEHMIGLDLHTMFYNENVDIQRLNNLPYTGSIQPLLNGDVEAFYGYATNEAYQLQQHNLTVRHLAPKNFGINFYGDSLVTTQQELAENPHIAESIRTAVIRGWSYALSHNDEIITYLLNLPTNNPDKFSRDHQAYEAYATDNLISANLLPIGSSDPLKWQSMFDAYNKIYSTNIKPNRSFFYIDNDTKFEEFKHFFLILAIGFFLTVAIFIFYNYSLKRKLNQFKAQLQHVAFSDEVTDIKNKSALRLYINELTSRRNLYLYIVDILSLKQINNDFGIDYTDGMLKEFAQYLVNEEEVIEAFRISGDQFAIIIRASSDELANLTVAALCISEKENFKNKINNFTVKAGGVSLEKTEAQKLDTILTCAEFALQKIKQHSPLISDLYQDQFALEQVEKNKLLKDIEEAVNKREFIPYFQPQVCPKTGKIVGAEALIRWQKSDGSLVAPGVFLPIVFTHPELAMKVESLMIRRVMATASVLIEKFDHPKRPFMVSINMSAFQFERGDLMDWLLNLCENYRVDPKHIELEIVESIAVNDLQGLIQKAKKIREAGFNIALDDFGTGYSALSHLQLIPINVLKIDRSFVLNLIESMRDRIMLQQIILLAKKLQLDVVVEGVENKEQIDIISEFSVDRFQGFYYFKPLPVEEVLSLSDTNPTGHIE